MRNMRLLDAFRVTAPGMGPGDHTCGAFRIPFRSVELHVIASSGEGWDHVSVSLPNRCPNWPEMCHVKHLFFRDDETCMQLHVPVADHINNHNFTLHLWRSQTQEIPRPPGWMVGVKGLSSEDVRRLPPVMLSALARATLDDAER